jgi:hypothetical protein
MEITVFLEDQGDTVLIINPKHSVCFVYSNILIYAIP